MDKTEGGKRFDILLFWSVCAVCAVCLTGCVSAQKGQAAQNEQIAAVPAFFRSVPRSPDMVYGIGSAKASNADDARRSAAAQARSDIAYQIHTVIESSLLTSDKEYRSGSSSYSVSSMESLSKQAAEAALASARIEKVEQTQDGTVYVLMSCPRAAQPGSGAQSAFVQKTGGGQAALGAQYGIGGAYTVAGALASQSGGAQTAGGHTALGAQTGSGGGHTALGVQTAGGHTALGAQTGSDGSVRTESVRGEAGSPAVLVSGEYFTGQGSGRTVSEARAKAYENLAMQVKVTIKSSYLEVRSSNSQGQDDISVVYRLEEGANITLPPPDKIIDRKLPDGSFEILVIISKQNMDRFTSELKREITDYIVSRLNSLNTSASASCFKQLFFLYDFLNSTGFASSIMFDEKDRIPAGAEIESRLNALLEKIRFFITPADGIVSEKTLFTVTMDTAQSVQPAGMPAAVSVAVGGKSYVLNLTLDADGKMAERLLSPAASEAAGPVSVTVYPDLAAFYDSHVLPPETARKLYIPKQQRTYTFIPDIKQGAMVHIPMGTYITGALSFDKLAEPDEKPQRTFTNPGFYIDETEVTNSEYAVFLSQNPHISVPKFWSNTRFNGKDQPVVGITQAEAAAYAAWAAKRLPSRIEWEAAARGPNGSIYQWGSSASDGIIHANSADDPYTEGTAAVKQYTPNSFGAYDMAGNVWEWTSSSYAGSDGSGYIVKGGSWTDPAEDLRISNNMVKEAEGRFYDVGFRCVKDRQ